MTLENLKKHHARLKWLTSSEFTERDFDYKIDANDNPHGTEKGEGGWSTMGSFINKAGQKRKELIIFKAKKTLEIFERKYPEFKEKKEEVKVEVKPSVEKTDKPTDKQKEETEVLKEDVAETQQETELKQPKTKSKVKK